MSGDRAAIQLPIESVQQHAVSVDRLSAVMDTARQAASAVTMDSQAYGQLCQFLPGILNGVFDLAVDAMRDSAEVLRHTATTLNTGATVTSDTSVASARLLRAAGGGAPAGD